MAIDPAKLEALIAKATNENLEDGGRYFDESLDDLTKCWHGDTGNYQNAGDGELIEYLWNHRIEILSLAKACGETPSTLNLEGERG